LFILFRIGGFFMRILMGFGEKDQPKSRQTKDGVNINPTGKGSINKKGYSGGEYVDYEEVD